MPSVVATNYDKFSTLPYLQLQGWTGADAFALVLVLMGLYVGYAYLNAGLVSIEPLRRSKTFIKNDDDKNNFLCVFRIFYRLSVVPH